MSKVFQIQKTFLLGAALSLGFLSLSLLDQKPAVADTGPVKLCNGSVQEEKINAAIMYYSHEKGGWVAKGWYVIEPGKCTLVHYYEGSMFAYAETQNKNWFWKDENSGTGFCAPFPAAFSGFQKTKCKKSEQFYQGININVPSDGRGYRFTFGDEGLTRDD